MTPHRWDDSDACLAIGRRLLHQTPGKDTARMPTTQTAPDPATSSPN
ncbi:hypothetical protein [Streptomyces sp. NPDC051636]